MPDQNPNYEKAPRPQSVEFFLQITKSHRKVTNIIKLDNFYFSIERNNLKELKVFLTNIYILSLADIYEIKIEHPDVNCIVTTSSWNSFSSEAKSFCKSDKIGLFDFNEYLGALNYDGKKFVNYELPKKD